MLGSLDDGEASKVDVFGAESMSLVPGQTQVGNPGFNLGRQRVFATGEQAPRREARRCGNE
jgi:hypothetical protein